MIFLTAPSLFSLFSPVRKMKRAAPNSLAMAIKLACLCFSLRSAAAETSPDTTTNQPPSAQELAKQKHNPFADQITVPLQISSSLDVGPGNGTTGGMSIQPAIPISLGENWKLIARPNLTLLLSEPPDRKAGLGDLEIQSYVTPALAGKWIWGVGPVLDIPTATGHEFGTGKWSAGPAVGLVYMNGPWVNGILANHIWSFAGPSDRDDVSQTTLEPVISYNFDSGWYLGFDSTMTSDWNARPGQRWTIPVGLDVGRTFQVGEQSLTLQVGTYYNVQRAEGAGKWLLRFQATFVFPRHASTSPEK